jgi:virginiamycin B lyase
MLFSIVIMEINLLTLLIMVILGVVVNYVMLKLLTEKLYPPGVFAGRQGAPGQKGESGHRGRIGERGPRAPAQSRGDKGADGNSGANSNCQIRTEYIDDDGNEVGGCNVMTRDWDMMGLTSYNARNKNGCLFGYKLNSGGICEAPIRGYKNRVDILQKYGIKDWEPDNNASTSNCNYKKSTIGELQPAQFKKWAELMAARDCPGVPASGLVPGAEGGPPISDFTDDKYKICSMIFKKCTDCDVQQGSDVCDNSNMKVATAGQVDHAWNKCELNTGKHGRIANEQFAYPVKSASGDYQAGSNINAQGGNDGVFCVHRDAPDADQTSTSLTAAPTPTEINTAQKCLDKAVAIHGNKVKARRSVQSGNWAHVPSGCSVQSGGDWAAHYNTHPKGRNSGGNYTIVKPTSTAISSAQECLNKAVEVYGNKVKASRSVQSGNWDHVPSGCSVQSGGDWAAHYNTHPKGAQGYKTVGYTVVTKESKPISSAQECLNVAIAGFGNKVKATRSVQSGNWGHVPSGCSVQSAGDWAAHYNTHPNAHNRHGSYTIVKKQGDTLVSPPPPVLNKWTKIPGGLKQVTASGKGWVWGVNSANQIYKCKKPCTGAWTQIPGGLKQVSADDKEVWGVNNAGGIYKRPVDGSGGWTNIRGGLKHVSASGNGWIWGVNSTDNIYKCKKPCTGAWTHLRDGGRLAMVSGGKTHVYGVASNKTIWKRPIDGSGSWVKIPGGLKEVSASNDGYVWGVNDPNDIWKCKEPCTGSWQLHRPGKLNQISSGTDYIWGIGNDGQSIWKKNKSVFY